MGWNYLSIPRHQRCLLTLINLITAWINKYTHYKMRDEIIYLHPNFHPILCNGCICLCMLGLKLIRVSKKGPLDATITYAFRFAVIFYMIQTYKLTYIFTAVYYYSRVISLYPYIIISTKPLVLHWNKLNPPSVNVYDRRAWSPM